MRTPSQAFAVHPQNGCIPVRQGKNRAAPATSDGTATCPYRPSAPVQVLTGRHVGALRQRGKLRRAGWNSGETWTSTGIKVAYPWVPSKWRKFWTFGQANLSKSGRSRRSSDAQTPRRRLVPVLVSCSTSSALHIGAIRGRMPGRHASAKTLIACVPRRNRPPTRLRARDLA